MGLSTTPLDISGRHQNSTYPGFNSQANLLPHRKQWLFNIQILHLDLSHHLLGWRRVFSKYTAFPNLKKKSSQYCTRKWLMETTKLCTFLSPRYLPNVLRQFKSVEQNLDIETLIPEAMSIQIPG
jgi:hypothetical protein